MKEKLTAAERVERLESCGNHGCWVKKATGQGANGGCQCDRRHLTIAVDAYRHAYADLLEADALPVDDAVVEQTIKTLEELRPSMVGAVGVPVDRLIAANRRLVLERDKALARCHSTWCAYCGAEFPADSFLNDRLGAHVVLCPSHPMRAVETERDETIGALEEEVKRLNTTLLLQVEPESQRRLQMECVRLREAYGNLCAVIFCDGGQRAAELGNDAGEEAEAIVLALREQVGRLQERRQEAFDDLTQLTARVKELEATAAGGEG